MSSGRRTLYHALHDLSDVAQAEALVEGYVSAAVDLLVRMERGERPSMAEVTLTLNNYRDSAITPEPNIPIGKKICGVVTKKGKTCTNEALEKFGGKCGTHRPRTSLPVSSLPFDSDDNIMDQVTAYDAENVNEGLSSWMASRSV